ncbi:MAG: hypothetical protein Q9159_001084 [Coniocarpon cinnabarinum]
MASCNNRLIAPLPMTRSQADVESLCRHLMEACGPPQATAQEDLQEAQVRYPHGRLSTVIGNQMARQISLKGIIHLMMTKDNPTRNLYWAFQSMAVTTRSVRSSGKQAYAFIMGNVAQPREAGQETRESFHVSTVSKVGL